MKITICDSTWERIWLVLTLRREETGAVSAWPQILLTDARGRIAALPELRAGEDPAQAKLRLNITNAGNARCLGAGHYVFAAVTEDGGTEPLALTKDLTGKLPALEASFSYERGRASTVVRPEAEGRHLCLNVEERREKNAEPAGRRLYRAAMHTFLRVYYRLHHRLRRTDGRQTVLLFSEQNDHPDGNLRALAERMRERGLTDRFRLTQSCRVTVTDRHLGLASWLKTVRRLAEADVVFLDDHAPVLDWLTLAEDTAAVQLWHAGVGFKASGYSRWGHEGSLPPWSAHRQYTWGVCGSEGSRDIFAELWGIDRGRVLPAGMPRLDALADPSRQERTRARLLAKWPQCRGKKVILFAPTYRGVNRKTAHYPYEVIDFEGLSRVLGEDAIVLFHMHPWVKEPVPIPRSCREKMWDVGGQEDINDIFQITDVLITDYSSNICEFSLRSRPMLFYAFDRAEYEAERGIHGDYVQMAPGRVAETFPELLRALAEEDYETGKLSAYREHYMKQTDAHGADRVIDWILLGQLPPQYAEEAQRAREKAARIGAPAGKRERRAES